MTPACEIEILLHWQFANKVLSFISPTVNVELAHIVQHHCELSPFLGLSIIVILFCFTLVLMC